MFRPNDGNLRQGVRVRARSPLVSLTLTLLLIASLPATTTADTTTETSITVTTDNAGSFSIAFDDLDDGYIFKDSDGNNQLTVSAIEGNTAFATVKITWTDDRADGQRAPYTISLAAGDLASEVVRPGGGVYSIPADQLSITRIGEEMVTPPAALDQPRSIFASSDSPPAGDDSLEIALRLNIALSTYPTSYTTTLRIEVIHGDDTP